MTDITETTIMPTLSESEPRSENVKPKSEEVPLLSPGENEVSETNTNSDTSNVSKADVRPTSTLSQDSFKRPLIGPLRKSSSNLRQGVKSEANIALEEKDTTKNKITSEVQIPKTEKGQPGDDTETPPPTDEDGTETKEATEPTKKVPVLSPAEQLKQSQKAIPYLEPKWGGHTEKEYFLEVLKNGSIIDTVKLTKKSFYVFGRLPACDVHLEHPSLSRYHAVLQYCSVPNDQHEVGWYLYDLESTHGTSINKLQVKPRVFYRVRVGFVLKFAGSSRLHILQGPDEDQEAESELTVTEMKEQKERRKQEEELAEKLSETESETADATKDEDSGCAWGMSDDAVNPEAETHIMELLPQNEELYLDDPKKTLKGFFEREGYDLPEYQFEEAGHGKHKCVVEVPVDSPTGQPVYAEAIVAGKRKDAVIACALEACRILDRYGLLRKKEHEARKVKMRDWEDNDYYGSDEDEFLDRTGEIQKKRELRMKRAGKLTEKAETYESLTSKLEEVVTEMDDIEIKLEKAKKDAVVAEAADLDALDAYMSSIKKGAIDTKTRMSLKRRLFDLRKERGRLERLVQIARPALLPKTVSGSKPGPTSGQIGGFARKIGGTGLGRPLLHMAIKSASQPSTAQTAPTPVTEEMDSDEEPEQKTTAQAQTTSPSTTQSEDVKGVEQTKPLQQTTQSEEESGESHKGNEEQSAQTTTVHGVKDPEQTTPVEPTPGMGRPEARLSKDESPQDLQTSTRGQGSADDTSKSQSKPDSGRTKSSTEDVPQITSGVGATRKRLADAQKSKTKKSKTGPLSKDYATDDPNYAVWVPPTGQTGDGKTHLNAKFGY